MDNFIHSIIEEDLTKKVHTRFPPEPNGYLHIGHAKSICLNFLTAKKYNGLCNLRFDDTNPTKEDTEYVDSIMEDVKWLGFDWEERLFYASDYFEKMYDCAVTLIKKGKAYVCDLDANQIKEYRGTLKEPGKNSPYRERSIQENLDLFEKMKKGEFENGEKVLRAKIDMASSNINMRDPIIYRIAHIDHHRTGNNWKIFPMYDFAHPLSDAFEEITYSICTLEFEDHRPLYNWFIDELDFKVKPRQIEFARLELTNCVMSKRKLLKLVEDKLVSGWDDPRMPTISGLRRKGYTPEAIRNFCELIGVSKALSCVDIGLLEHCIREDLKLKQPRLMAVLNPIKLTISNYPDDLVEELIIENNQENDTLGSRIVKFSKNLYIDQNDFMENPPKKYFRLFEGSEVRLKGAYIIKCEEVIKDENGNILELICTYDPETKSGGGSTKKVKGIIHWVSREFATPCEIRLYDHLFDEMGEFNNDSVKILDSYIEPEILNYKTPDSFQLIREGYFSIDKESSLNKLILNRIVSLKSSFKIDSQKN